MTLGRSLTSLSPYSLLCSTGVTGSWSRGCSPQDDVRKGCTEGLALCRQPREAPPGSGGWGGVWSPGGRPGEQPPGARRRPCSSSGASDSQQPWQHLASGRGGRRPDRSVCSRSSRVRGGCRLHPHPGGPAGPRLGSVTSECPCRAGLCVPLPTPLGPGQPSCRKLWPLLALSSHVGRVPKPPPGRARLVSIWTGVSRARTMGRHTGQQVDSPGAYQRTAVGRDLTQGDLPSPGRPLVPTPTLPPQR